MWVMTRCFSPVYTCARAERDGCIGFPLHTPHGSCAIERLNLRHAPCAPIPARSCGHGPYPSWLPRRKHVAPSLGPMHGLRALMLGLKGQPNITQG